MQVNIVNKSQFELPKYETILSAGMDLRANIDKDVFLFPGEREILPTGIHIQLPEGQVAKICSRSGLAAKSGIAVLNAPGIIDPDFTGEIKVILVNLSNQPFIIEKGDRIAQMVIAKFDRIEWNQIETLDVTERGEGGLGHTGVK